MAPDTASNPGNGDADRPVVRCICHDVPFSELLRRQRETGETLEQLQKATGCGTGCGLCLPYIRVALRTGEAQLKLMSDAELKRLGGLEQP